MECLVGPLRTADQIRLLAFRSFFSECSVAPLHLEVMERAAELRASTRLQAADAIHLAAAVHWGCDALLTNDRAFQLSQAPIEAQQAPSTSAGAASAGATASATPPAPP